MNPNEHDVSIISCGPGGSRAVTCLAREGRRLVHPRLTFSPGCEPNPQNSLCAEKV